MSDIRTPPDATAGVAVDETERLIAADKVQGTSVYDPQGSHIGSVYNVMIDKYSGQVAYAVISFGGFLGIGADYYPLPWGKLRYEHGFGGYVTDVSREQLEQAPRYSAGKSPWNDPSYGRGVYDYYGQDYYL